VLGGLARRQDEGPDRVCRGVHALVRELLERHQSLVLHGIVGVDDEAIREEVLAPELYHECVRGVAPVLDRVDQDEINPAQRHAPGEFNGARQVAVLAGGGFVELRDVEHDGQRREVGRAEEVARHAQFPGDVERPRAEEVRHERRDAGRGGEEAAEEVLKVRERTLDYGEDAGLDAGVGGEVVERHLWQHGRGDGRGEGGEHAGQVARRGEVGVGDQRGREAALCHDSPRELRHGQDVARAGARQQHDVTTCAAGAASSCPIKMYVETFSVKDECIGSSAAPTLAKRA
jgi:hypothetical protein